MLQIKALTIDGSWWRLNNDPTQTPNAFAWAWSRIPSDSLLLTKENGVYIQKRNIVALQIENE